MTKLKIVGICGSLRAKSFNLSALHAAGSLMPEGMSMEIAPLHDLPMYNADLQEKGMPESVQKLRDIMASADGLMIAAPEFNWTISAPLKNMIDWVSRFPAGQQPFLQKPVAIVSATIGPLGGARVQYDVRRSLSGLGVLDLVKPEIFINNANTKFDATGKLTDEATLKIMKEQMVAFQDWIVRMKRAYPGWFEAGRLHSYAQLTKGVDIIARIHIDSLDCLFKMNAKLSFVLAFAAACVTTATVAQELKGDAQAGSTKIAMCIGCHGIKGYQASFPEVYKVPMISGQGAKYIASSLNAYKSGERKHPTMKGISQSLTDQDIADISAYYEQHGTPVAVPEKAAEAKGKGAELLAKGACASCHGPNLNKPIDPSYPKIAGQHKDYLFVALKSYKTEGQATWGRSNGVMGGIAKQFTNAELKELAQYISTQPGELRVVPQSKFR